MPHKLTRAAFDTYRAGRSLKKMHPDARRYEGDTDLLTADDGLDSWKDGEAAKHVPRTEPPIVGAEPAARRLWVVTAGDVLHAAETCAFARSREAQAVKHSNLTGGGSAYAGGEMVFLDDRTVLLNGCSGRYRITNEAELKAVAGAFRSSGYMVWSMGWNSDTNRPAMFGTQDPEWVA